MFFYKKTFKCEGCGKKFPGVEETPGNIVSPASGKKLCSRCWFKQLKEDKK